MGKRVLLGALAILLVIAAAYASFYIAPEERTMGVVQRIFYFHVGSAWAGMDAFLVCFICNLLYIWKREQKYDWLGVAAAEVGLVLTTVVLITGPIWAKPAWGIYWTWDARLTSMLILFFIYFGYIALRQAHHGAGERAAIMSSLFAVVGLINIPIIKFSVYLWNTLHQGSSVFRLGGIAIHETMLIPLVNTILFFAFFSCIILILRILDIIYMKRAERIKNFYQ